MTWSELDAIAVDYLSCDYCHAVAGARCVVAKGRTAGTPTTTHSGRVTGPWRGWTVGYVEGARDAIEEFLVDLRRRSGEIPRFLEVDRLDTLLAQLRSAAYRRAGIS